MCGRCCCTPENDMHVDSEAGVDLSLTGINLRLTCYAYAFGCMNTIMHSCKLQTNCSLLFLKEKALRAPDHLQCRKQKLKLVHPQVAIASEGDVQVTIHKSNNSERYGCTGTPFQQTASKIAAAQAAWWRDDPCRCYKGRHLHQGRAGEDAGYPAHPLMCCISDKNVESGIGMKWKVRFCNQTRVTNPHSKAYSAGH